MTEEDFVADDGSVQHTGKANPLAQAWADLMTAKYDELSAAEIVFGQLRNLMDLCVIAALIERKQLRARADCQLSLLTRSDSALMTDSWNPAKEIATQCSFIKKGRNYIITASGGVEISSWRVIEKTRTDAGTARQRQQATPPATTSWWWN